jgi:hypothetical protein
MHDVTVIEDPAAEISLDPIDSRLLAELTRPGSATTLAARLVPGDDRTAEKAAALAPAVKAFLGR